MTLWVKYDVKKTQVHELEMLQKVSKVIPYLWYKKKIYWYHRKISSPIPMHSQHTPLCITTHFTIMLSKVLFCLMTLCDYDDNFFVSCPLSNDHFCCIQWFFCDKHCWHYCNTPHNTTFCHNRMACCRIAPWLHILQACCHSIYNLLGVVVSTVLIYFFL